MLIEKTKFVWTLYSLFKKSLLIGSNFYNRVDDWCKEYNNQINGKFRHQFGFDSKLAYNIVVLTMKDSKFNITEISNIKTKYIFNLNYQNCTLSIDKVN